MDQKICSNQQMFELLKSVIKAVVRHQNGRRAQETSHFFQEWSISTGYAAEGEDCISFPTFRFRITVLQLTTPLKQAASLLRKFLL